MRRKTKLLILVCAIMLLFFGALGCTKTTQVSDPQLDTMNSNVGTQSGSETDGTNELSNTNTAINDPNKDDNTSNRTVIDMTGNTIVLPNEVEKVFCDWPSGITLVMTLGATEKLVAAHSAFETDTFAWARIICPSIDEVPKDDAPFSNPEAILNYNPDIVITNNKENIDIYTKLGLTVVYVDYNSNSSFKESMRIVGDAIGLEESNKASTYIMMFDDNVKLVAERLSIIADNSKPSVYYMDSRFGDAYHTVGAGEIQEEWITAAGGVLATAEEFSGRNLEITAEKLLEIDPDIIMIGAQKQAEVMDMLLADQVLSGLKAISNNAVYRIPQGIFPWCRTGPEAAMQPVWAAKTLYPELFADIDLVEFASHFYKEFYGTDVPKEVISEILKGKLNPSAN